MITSVIGLGQLSARDNDFLDVALFPGILRAVAKELSRTSLDLSQHPADDTEGSLCECRHSSWISFTYGTQHDTIDGPLAENILRTHT